MNSYIGKVRLSDSHFDITLNLDELSKFQEQIATKYESREGFICKQSGSKNFIERFDRYILHCLEEIVEAREEIRKNPFSKDSVMELIDIFLYLGTMNSIIRMNLDHFQMRTVDVVSLDYYVANRNIEQIDVKLMDISELLVEQRRLFPQRKWHKPSSEFSDLQMKYVVNEIYRMNIEAIKIVLDLILNAARSNHIIVNDNLNYKQQYVLSLPMPK